MAHSRFSQIRPPSAELILLFTPFLSTSDSSGDDNNRRSPERTKSSAGYRYRSSRGPRPAEKTAAVENTAAVSTTNMKKKTRNYFSEIFVSTGKDVSCLHIVIDPSNIEASLFPIIA